MANNDMLDEEESGGGVKIDFTRLLLSIYKKLPWIILCVVIGFVAARIYLRYQIPTYNVSSNILVNSSEANTVKVIGSVIGEEDPSIENEIFLLKSYSIVKKVVDSLDLNIGLTQDARIKELPLDVQTLPFRINVKRPDTEDQRKKYKLKIFNDYYTVGEDNDEAKHEYDKSFMLGKDTVTVYKLGSLAKYHGDMFNFTIEETDKIIKKYISRLNIAPVKGGNGILQVSINDEVPTRAQRFVTVLIREYDRITIQFKNKSVRSALDFLIARLEVVGEELEEQENRERDYRSANNLYDISETAGTVLSNLNSLDAQKNTAEYNNMLLVMLENHVRVTDQTELFPNASGIPDVILSGLVSKYNDLLLKKRMVLDLGTPNDPNLGAISGQLKEVRGNVLKNIENIKSQFNLNKEYLSDLDAQYTRKLKNLPQKEKDLIRIKRELTSKETLYKFLLQKKEETAIQLMSSDVAGSRVIDAPQTTGQVTPKSQMVYIIFIAIGLLLPVSIIVIRTLLNQKVESKKDIEASTSIPIVGEISLVDINAARPILTFADSKKLITEQFRVLRSNLSYMGLNSEKNVVLITSSISGEGKSFIALNLSNILAQTGKRVAVIEFDLRKPMLSERLGMENTKGISEFIALEDMKVSDIVKPLPDYPNLYLVNSGPIPPNPAELILSSKVTEMMSYLKQNFDYVVIDTAPAGIVSDTLGLAHFADVTLYIIRHNFTLKPTINYLNQFARERKLYNPAVVVYGTEKQKSGYGYNYGYGYGYGNNGYYEDEVKPGNRISRMLKWKKDKKK